MSKEMKIKDAIRVIALHTWKTLEEVHDFIYLTWGPTERPDQKETIKRNKRVEILDNLHEVLEQWSKWKINLKNRSEEDQNKIIKLFEYMSRDMWEQQAYETIKILIPRIENIRSLFSKILKYA